MPQLSTSQEVLRHSYSQVYKETVPKRFTIARTLAESKSLRVAKIATSTRGILYSERSMIVCRRAGKLKHIPLANQSTATGSEDVQDGEPGAEEHVDLGEDIETESNAGRESDDEFLRIGSIQTSSIQNVFEARTYEYNVDANRDEDVDVSVDEDTSRLAAV